MAPIRFEIGELPEQLTDEILHSLKRDSKFALADIQRGTDLSTEQVATFAAVLAMGSEWHTRLEVNTRDRIRLMVERYFTPAERAVPDPLAANADAFSAHSATARFDELEDPANVVTLPPISGFAISDTRERT